MHVKHNVTLGADVSRQLDVIAEELGEEKSCIIEKALTVYFDFLDLKSVGTRLKDYKMGKDTALDADTVWANLGI